jgi:peptidyl-prolyl cis-trans isomerase D
MISSFRRYLETWYVRAFFMVMVVSFVLWGVGDMLRVVGTSTWVARVGGTTIEAQTVEQAYRRALQAASRDLPDGQEASPALRQKIADATLRRLIGEAAMTEELARMRIVVPQPALVAAARSMPALQGKDGKFDPTRLQSLLQANGMTEAEFLELVRADIARQELLDAVTAGATVPDREAKLIYAAEYEKRSADIAAFPFAAMPAPPTPDDKTARRWYDNHPDAYVTPEYRTVKLIVLSPETLAADVTVTDQEVRDSYAAHRSEYTTIGKRSAEVISTHDEATAEKLAAQWRAGADWTTIQAAAKTAGAVALAQDNATRVEYPDPDLAKAVFAAPVNTVPPPVKGALGWFVIRVTHEVKGGVKPFEAVEKTLRERLRLDKALDLVYDRANKIDNLLGNGTSLDALPASLGVHAITVTVDKDGVEKDGSTAQIPGESEIASAVLTAAFSAQKGDPPQLTEVKTPSTGGSGYYALSVEDIQPSARKPFASVRARVNDDWRTDQRHHEAEVAATAMMQAVKGGKNFSDAARDAGVMPYLSPLATRTSITKGMPVDVQNVLFSLKKGEPTMVETGDAFLVATPVEIVAPNPDTDPANYARVKQALTRTVATDLASAFEEALRLRAKPRINRTNLAQIAQP